MISVLILWLAVCCRGEMQIEKKRRNNHRNVPIQKRFHVFLKLLS